MWGDTSFDYAKYFLPYNNAGQMLFTLALKWPEYLMKDREINFTG